MQCPGCGLYHPARYEQCVSCGRRFSDPAPALPGQDPRLAREEDSDEYEPGDEEEDDELSGGGQSPGRTSAGKSGSRAKTRSGGKKFPLLMVMLAVGIIIASAGGTYFFLSRPPESARLLSEGQKQLANGQYAFAQKTLEQAMAIKPNDGRILLSLARAYVGTDQVERAWSCISQAQQSGAGLMAEPQLTSDLAKYYVQRNQFARAVELLRPLAQENIAGKKTELSDLNALWGDQCFNRGDTQQALKCWEEVKTLAEGSRLNEVDTRLATIYQKMATELLSKDDTEGALNCLNNLNQIAPSPQSYEKVADLYAKKNKLDLAIDQMRKAIKVGNGSHDLNSKLASLLAKRGKELLERGDAQTGYAYLQQAQGYDSKLKVPTVALRSVSVNVDAMSGTLRCQGEAWNPGPSQVSYLSVRSELYDSKASQSVWSKEQKIVDEFVPPLQASESRQFDLSGPIAVGQPGLELRVYLDGRLYQTYPIGESGGAQTAATHSSGSARLGQEHSGAEPSGTIPQLRPPIQTQSSIPPPVSPPPVSFPPQQTTPDGMMPGEKTMKDLED